jgi:hypothetical protein
MSSANPIFSNSCSLITKKCIKPNTYCMFRSPSVSTLKVEITINKTFKFYIILFNYHSPYCCNNTTVQNLVQSTRVSCCCEYVFIGYFVQSLLTSQERFGWLRREGRLFSPQFLSFQHNVWNVYRFGKYFTVQIK